MVWKERRNGLGKRAKRFLGVSFRFGETVRGSLGLALGFWKGATRFFWASFTLFWDLWNETNLFHDQWKLVCFCGWRSHTWLVIMQLTFQRYFRCSQFCEFDCNQTILMAELLCIKEFGNLSIWKMLHWLSCDYLYMYAHTLTQYLEK